MKRLLVQRAGMAAKIILPLQIVEIILEGVVGRHILRELKIERFEFHPLLGWQYQPARLREIPAHFEFFESVGTKERLAAQGKNGNRCLLRGHSHYHAVPGDIVVNEQGGKGLVFRIPQDTQFRGKLAQIGVVCRAEGITFLSKITGMGIAKRPAQHMTFAGLKLGLRAELAEGCLLEEAGFSALILQRDMENELVLPDQA